MYCATSKQTVCQRLPWRLKPQTAASVAAFPFLAVRPSQIYRNQQAVSYTIFLQCMQDLFLYRAKSLSYLGLLALFFCKYLAHN